MILYVHRPLIFPKHNMTEVKSCLYDLTIIINGCILHWFKDTFLYVLIIGKESFNRNSKDKIYDEEWFFLSFLGITMIWIIFDSNKFYNLVHLMSRITKRDRDRDREREKLYCAKQLRYERIQSIFTQFEELIRDCFN